MVERKGKWAMIGKIMGWGMAAGLIFGAGFVGVVAVLVIFVRGFP